MRYRIRWKGCLIIPARIFIRSAYTTAKAPSMYADKSVPLNGYSLFFGTPYIPYSWSVESARHNSFSCIFTEDFLNNSERLKSLQESALFKTGGTPVFILDEFAYLFIKSIFQKMLEEQASAYTTNAASRITSLFLELLEMQGPIDNPHQSLQIKNPQDFAERLNIHVNHFNRSVKETTGKTTKEHIMDRITSEAKAFLLHTDWGVADIAYALGFEYPTYFNNFFKRVTGTIPNSLRKYAIV